MKILIIDDSTAIRRIISNEVKQKFEEIFTANDGVEAQEVIKENDEFDIIICDWHMPNCNGLEFLRIIRAQGIETPFIMVTTEGIKTNIIKAIQAGATYFIKKPAKPGTILEKINDILDS